MRYCVRNVLGHSFALISPDGTWDVHESRQTWSFGSAGSLRSKLGPFAHDMPSLNFNRGSLTMRHEARSAAEVRNCFHSGILRCDTHGECSRSNEERLLP
jgi:hypothetical protein